MRQPVFIRLENTFEEAMQYDNAPQMDIYSFNGIRLLPNTPHEYTQRTYVEGGIELEDFTASLFTVCGNEETVLPTALFSVTPFQDEEDGTNQIYWTYKTDDTDLGMQMVYLRFKQCNDYFYSSPFQLTADEAEYTSRFDYWDEENDTVLSTQLDFQYIQPLLSLGIEEYQGIYTGGYQSVVSTNIKARRYRFGIVFIELMLLFADMMENDYVYINYQRCSLFKTFELPELQGRENFAEVVVDLYVNKYDVYDPNFVPFVPPVPPVELEIILESVVGLSGNQVVYTHSVVGFEPTYLTYEYSLDQITWITATNAPDSPHTQSGINWSANNYYYRITHTGTGTVSNVLQIAARTIVITNMTAKETVWRIGYPVNYRIFFDINNFTTLANTGMLIQFSTNDFSSEDSSSGAVTFPLVMPITGEGNNITFSAPPSGLQYKFFRLTYATFGIVSNIYEFELPEL